MSSKYRWVMLGEKAAKNLDAKVLAMKLVKQAGLFSSIHQFVSFTDFLPAGNNTWGASEKGIFCLLMYFSLLSLTYEKLKEMYRKLSYFASNKVIEIHGTHQTQIIPSVAIEFFF